MSSKKIFAVGCFAIVTTIPALADSVPSLKPGELLIIEPDGHLAIVEVTDPKLITKLKIGLEPLGYCRMLIAAADGSLWWVNAERRKHAAVCEDFAE